MLRGVPKEMDEITLQEMSGNGEKNERRDLRLGREYKLVVPKSSGKIRNGSKFNTAEGYKRPNLRHYIVRIPNSIEQTLVENAIESSCLHRSSRSDNISTNKKDESLTFVSKTSFSNKPLKHKINLLKETDLVYEEVSNLYLAVPDTLAEKYLLVKPTVSGHLSVEIDMDSS